MKKSFLLSIFILSCSKVLALTPSLSFGSEWSSVYQLSAKAQLVNTLGSHGAASFSIQAGKELFRLGLNLAYQFNQHNRVRLGIAHLAQRPELDFTAFPTRNWAGQPAISSTYEYLLGKPHLQGLRLFGLFATARSTQLNLLPFTVNQQTFFIQRHVAGGTLFGGGGGVEFSLWSAAHLLVNGHYDHLHFHTLYEPGNDRQGVGASARFNQELPAGFALTAFGAVRSIFDDYGLGTSWTHQFANHHILTFGIYAALTKSSILPADHDKRLGLNVAYAFDAAKASLSPTEQSLLRWATDSEAALPGVFVMRDQRILSAP